MWVIFFFFVNTPFTLKIICSNCDNSIFIGLVNCIDAFKLELYFVLVLLCFLNFVFVYFRILLLSPIKCLI